MDSIELFPSDMLDGVISDYLTNPETEEIWFTETQNEKPISIGYCVPEKLKEGTYNLYALGVSTDIQSKGTGSRMIVFIKKHLRKIEKRMLIIETSSTEAFKKSREFY